MEKIDLRGKETVLMVLSALIWVAITVLGWLSIWFPGLFLGLILMFIYMLMGSSSSGLVNKKFTFYPILCFVIIWAIGFMLSYYWGNIYKGSIPAFTIAGLHPSFASTVLLYWIGGILTLTVGFLTRKDLWLSREEWNEFLQNVNQLKEERNKGGQ